MKSLKVGLFETCEICRVIVGVNVFSDNVAK